VLGLAALLVFACNGRLEVLEPPVAAAAGSGGSSGVGEPIQYTGGSGGGEAVTDAGPPTPTANAEPIPESSPCTCKGSPNLLALGCITKGVSGAPLVSDDGQTVTFDTCDESGLCQPYRWTRAGGAQPLPVPSQGGTVAHLSPDGDVLVITPRYDAEAIVYRASDDSSVGTGLRAYYASLALSGRDSVVGLVRNSSPPQLARWTRSGGLELLGALPFNAVNVLLVGSPNSETIAGINYDGDTTNELFRWTPEEGLEIQPLDLPLAPNGAPLRLSRNGAALATYVPGDEGEARIVRWTDESVSEIGTRRSDYLDPLDISGDGAVVVGSIVPRDEATCGPSFTSCGFASAFRWTEAGGAVQLTPGFGSRASLVSRDGSFVMGELYDGTTELFSWTVEHGARKVRPDLESLGVDYTDWLLTEPRAMAADARVVVGFATCGTGGTIYRLELPDERPQPN
jgi:hypothetical protein